jgi:hypothetical protein
MTAILATGGQALAAVKSTQFATFGNPSGVERLLTGGLNINANSATTDYRLQMGTLRDFTTAVGTPVDSTVDLLPSAWVAGQKYRVTRILYDNATVSLTTATAGVFSAVAAGGVTIVTSAALSALTAAAINAAGSGATPTIANATTLFDLQQLFFRIGTAQGAAARLDVYIFGIVMP